MSENFPVTELPTILFLHDCLKKLDLIYDYSDLYELYKKFLKSPYNLPWRDAEVCIRAFVGSLLCENF